MNHYLESGIAAVLGIALGFAVCNVLTPPHKLTAPVIVTRVVTVTHITETPPDSSPPHQHRDWTEAGPRLPHRAYWKLLCGARRGGCFGAYTSCLPKPKGPAW